MRKIFLTAFLALIYSISVGADRWNMNKYPDAEPINESILGEFTWSPGESNRPIGKARGIYPGRVVMTRFPEACKWKGRWKLNEDQWYLPENRDLDKCR